MHDHTDARLRELADFIRVRRARLSPELCGLDAGSGQRRTPGLRREELGRLAGLSADWIAWLEQGRDIKLSPPAASRLARALQLDQVETEHLNALTSGHPVRDLAASPVSAALQAIIDGQDLNPAYVTDPLGEVLARNGAARLVFQDFGHDGPGRANLLRYMFLDQASRNIVDWEHYAERIVAKFRLWHDRSGGDARFAGLARELRGGSAEFDAIWVTHAVRKRSNGRKVVRHPMLGKLGFQYCSFQVEEVDTLTMTLLVPDPACPHTLPALRRALSLPARMGAALPG